MIIYSDKILQPDKIISGYIKTNQDKIEEIIEDNKYSQEKYSNATDMTGYYVLPGLINIDSYKLEMQCISKSNAMYPFIKKLIDQEQRTLQSGITTSYNTISMEDDKENHFQRGRDILSEIRNIRNKNYDLIDNKTHLKFEISLPDTADKLKEIVNKNLVDFISFQVFSVKNTLNKYKNFYIERYIREQLGLDEEATERILAKIEDQRANSNLEEISYLLKYAHYKDIRVATSQIKSAKTIKEEYKETVDMIYLTEENLADEIFNNLEVPAVADISMLTNKATSQEVKNKIMNGQIDILTAQKQALNLLYVMFTLAKETGLPKIVNMVSQNPAKAMKLDQKGTIKKGNIADLILVKEISGLPVVRHAITRGNLVYSLNI